MTQPKQAGTRQRLIEAAGEVFAEHGFRAAQVREICRRAGANGAAVNYHFGGKNKLYRTVLHDAFIRAMRKYPPDLGLSPSAGPRQRLHAFIRSMLLRMLDTRQHAWFGRLMAREQADPTVALDELVGKFFRPLFLDLLAILRPILGTGDPRRLYYAGASIVAQCSFYYQNGYVFDRLYPQQKHGPRDIERLADHVIRFSLGGLRAVAEGGRRRKLASEATR